MTCDDVQRAISARLDGDDVAIDEHHLATCAACAEFERGARSLRAALRFEVLDDAPDVAPAVLRRIERVPSRRRWTIVPVAAALLAGVIAGAAFVWPQGNRSDIAAASIPARIVKAQGDVVALAARVAVSDPDGETTGMLRYRAPESMELRLGATSLTTDGGRWTLVDASAKRTSVIGVEPFASDSPLPLDLVLPVAAFARATDPVTIGTKTIDGHRALGVRVTAAQVAALLEGLQLVGVGRHVYAADAVDLWLDEAHLMPLDVVIRAASGIDRARWAAARGFDDDAGEVVFEARFSDVVLNDLRSVEDIGPPPTAQSRDDGFRDGPAGGPAPTWLPGGMRTWRSGEVGAVEVHSWTDGRAWVKVRSTTTWQGPELFGIPGPAAHVVMIGDGVGYESEDGAVVALHARGVDVSVTGSVAPEALRRIAASTAVRGRLVPDTWQQATTASVDEAARQLLVLVLPADAPFSPPAVRLVDGTATFVFAGAGARGLVMTTRVGTAVTPPLDPDAVGVEVRRRAARWSPGRGELEWTEGGQLWSMRSTTIGLDELVQLADQLAARP